MKSPTLKTGRIVTFALVVLIGVAVVVYWSATPTTAGEQGNCPPGFSEDDSSVCPDADHNGDGTVCVKNVPPKKKAKKKKKATKKKKGPGNIVCIDNNLP